MDYKSSTTLGFQKGKGYVCRDCGEELKTFYRYCPHCGKEIITFLTKQQALDYLRRHQAEAEA